MLYSAHSSDAILVQQADRSDAGSEPHVTAPCAHHRRERERENKGVCVCVCVCPDLAHENLFVAFDVGNDARAAPVALARVLASAYAQRTRARGSVVD
eukprot:3093799-Rhodomonas_salina.1